MFEQFENALEESIIYDLNYLLRKYGSEDIFAVALTTDTEFTTMRIALATVSFLKSCADSNIFKSFSEFTGIAWHPEEWHIFSNENPESKLLNLHHEIDSLYRKSTDFDKYKEEMETVFITALKNSTLKSHLKSNVFKFVYDTDSSREDYLPNKSSKILNTTEVHEDFLERYTKQFNFYPSVKIKSNKRFLP